MIKKSKTCIAITKNSRGKLMMASERCVTLDGDVTQSMTWPKINKKEGLLLGASGNGDLCSFLVEDGGFKVPERKVKNINTYMYYTFKPAIIKAIVGQNYIDINKQIAFPADYNVDLLIGIEGQVWSLSLGDIKTMSPSNRVALERLPETTTAIGCGGMSALAIMKHELRSSKYLTKDQLKDIFNTVGNLIPGCDTNCDIIQED